MTIQEITQILSDAGWQQLDVGNGFAQYKCESPVRFVTLFGEPEQCVPSGVVRAVMKHAEVEKGS